jgi:hypothetical protein
MTVTLIINSNIVYLTLICVLKDTYWTEFGVGSTQFSHLSSRYSKYMNKWPKNLHIHQNLSCYFYFVLFFWLQHFPCSAYQKV